MKTMSIREIAELCEVAESTVRSWIGKTAETAGIIAKTADSQGKAPVAFALPEVLAIIRAGGKNTLASLLEDQTRQKPSQFKLPSGTQLHEFRMIYGKDAASRMDFLIGFSRQVAANQAPLTDEERRIVDAAFPRLRLLAERGPSQGELALGGGA